MVTKHERGKRVSVAVIGAGPAGLAVARELLREGHAVTVFEASGGVGGAWRFEPTTTEHNPLGLPATDAARVHSSMYAGLRTNLPRHTMSLCDFPFSSAALGPRAHDPRPYPLHTEVLAYCEALADAAGLRRCLQLHTRVVRIDPVDSTEAAATVTAAPQDKPAEPASAAAPLSSPCGAAAHARARIRRTGLQQQPKQGQQQQQQHPGPEQRQQEHPPLPAGVRQWHGTRWKVTTSRAPDAGTGTASPRHQRQQPQQQPQQQQQQEWLFDAVASCIGTFSVPSLPQIPGMESWPGVQLHSHNFRGGAQFKGQRVLVVGASFSGEEIARLVAAEASHVYQSARTYTGPGTAREPPLGDGLDPQKQPQQEQQQQPQQQQQQPQQQQPYQQQEQQQSPVPEPAQPRPNLTRLPMLQELLPDGGAVFRGGGRVLRGLDAIVYCTGYGYAFPFMDHLQLLDTDDACVRPLFAHMFIPCVGPSLALIGLPWRCLKVPQFQLQGQLLARLLSGAATLPARHVMEAEQQQLFAAMRGRGIPLRYTHCMASCMPEDGAAYAQRLVQLAANSGGGNVPANTLQNCTLGTPNHVHAGADSADEEAAAGACCGPACCTTASSQASPTTAPASAAPPERLVSFPGWMGALAAATAGRILTCPDTFRDEWGADVDQLMQQADQAMAQCLREHLQQQQQHAREKAGGRQQQQQQRQEQRQQ